MDRGVSRLRRLAAAAALATIMIGCLGIAPQAWAADVGSVADVDPTGSTAMDPGVLTEPISVETETSTPTESTATESVDVVTETVATTDPGASATAETTDSSDTDAADGSGTTAALDATDSLTEEFSGSPPPSTETTSDPGDASIATGDGSATTEEAAATQAVTDDETTVTTFETLDTTLDDAASTRDDLSATDNDSIQTTAADVTAAIGDTAGETATDAIATTMDTGSDIVGVVSTSEAGVVEATADDGAPDLASTLEGATAIVSEGAALLEDVTTATADEIATTIDAGDNVGVVSTSEAGVVEATADSIGDTVSDPVGTVGDTVSDPVGTVGDLSDTTETNAAMEASSGPTSDSDESWSGSDTATQRDPRARWNEDAIALMAAGSRADIPSTQAESSAGCSHGDTLCILAFDAVDVGSLVDAVTAIVKSLALTGLSLLPLIVIGLALAMVGAVAVGITRGRSERTWSLDDLGPDSWVYPQVVK